ncbi:MAG: hypothetical protein HY749_16360 [Gammaproteobacteria bacterium]|nr:hypothetical protein [Gammaproteobacteria bacterium]
MIPRIRTLLLGDQTEAARWVPFAAGKLRALQAIIAKGVRKACDQTFQIGGVSIALRADEHGGRIVITAAAVLARLRVLVATTDSTWSQLATAPTTLVPHSAVTVPAHVASDGLNTIDYRELLGELSYRTDALRMRRHNPDGTLAWEERATSRDTPSTGITTESTASAVRAAAYAGAHVVWDEIDYREYYSPIIGWLREALPCYVRASADTGVVDLRVATASDDYFDPSLGISVSKRFFPLCIAGYLGTDGLFFALGYMYEVADRSTPDGLFTPWDIGGYSGAFELHAVDAATLVTVARVTVATTDGGQAVQLIADEHALPYVADIDAGGLLASVFAYSRALERVLTRDFLLIGASLDPRTGVAVCADQVYAKAAGVTTLFRFVPNVTRAGTVVTDLELSAASWPVDGLLALLPTKT